ncbi:hypothetical protein CHS0354_028261, partial [Potamilus streckersoni]
MAQAKLEMNQPVLEQNQPISKLKDFFAIKAEGRAVHVYHPYGCQEIDFGETDSCPRQAE